MQCTDNEYISIMPVRRGYIEHKEWLCNDLAGPLVWSSFGWWVYYNLVQFVKMVSYSFDCQGQLIKLDSCTLIVVALCQYRHYNLHGLWFIPHFFNPWRSRFSRPGQFTTSDSPGFYMNHPSFFSCLFDLSCLLLDSSPQSGELSSKRQMRDDSYFYDRVESSASMDGAKKYPPPVGITQSLGASNSSSLLP